MGNRLHNSKAAGFPALTALLLLLLWSPMGSVAAPPLASQIRFDVFFGYDGFIRGNAWFPVTLEIQNDGQGFSGSIEVEDASSPSRQVRTLEMEFPNATLKRVTIPCYASSWGYSSWDVRLLTRDRKIVLERTGLRPRAQLESATPLLGAICRESSSIPQILKTASPDLQYQPAVARILSPLLPDNSLCLEGLSAVYLNSEKAAELTPAQADALAHWTFFGGHLIVALEQLQDVSAPLLRKVLPGTFSEIHAIQHAAALQQWISSDWDDEPYLNSDEWIRQPGRIRRGSARPPRAGTPFQDLAPDLAFETNALRVAIGTVHRATTVLEADGVPLILRKTAGQGEITVLMFSPEREPLRSWSNAPVFWAKLANVPLRAFDEGVNSAHPGRWAADAVMGAILDTTQVRTLPLGFLFLLLVAYVAVIGPFDYFWLKRLRKPMLTWLTFPGYVIAFSSLIYFIGFKLRSGELEWNELHVLDVIQDHGSATARGRSYGSLYSPGTRTYRFHGPSFRAGFRSETAGNWRARASGQPLKVVQEGNTFAAAGSVPVWTSQIFVTEWESSVAVPWELTFSTNNAGFDVRIRNHSRTQLQAACIKAGVLYNLGTVESGATLEYNSREHPGTDLISAQRTLISEMQSAASMRNMAFGRSQGRHLENWPAVLQVLSTYPGFASPPGFNLLHSAMNDRQAVVFLWADNFSPVASVAQFNPPRSHKRTFWRVVINSPSNAETAAASGQPQPQFALRHP